MASEPPVVVYDACVLYPFHLANLRLSEPTAEEYLQALENQGLKSFVSLIRTTTSGGR